jgi:hypothetical protein
MVTRASLNPLSKRGQRSPEEGVSREMDGMRRQDY